MSITRRENRRSQHNCKKPPKSADSTFCRLGPVFHSRQFVEGELLREVFREVRQVGHVDNGSDSEGGKVAGGGEAKDA